MIAHRLSTVVHADRIIVLRDGLIVEEGSHGELLAHGGLYASMWNRQLEAAEAAERLRAAREADTEGFLEPPPPPDAVPIPAAE
jgi:ATP-binding cassette subfamily B protein